MMGCLNRAISVLALLVLGSGCSGGKTTKDSGAAEGGSGGENANPGGSGGKSGSTKKTSTKGGSSNGGDNAGGTNENAGGNPAEGGTTVAANTPAILVTPTEGLKVPEDAGTATFTLKLNTKPTANVTIALSNSAPTAATIDKSEILFTPENFGLAQTVTITGVTDAYDDGNEDFVIITAAAVSEDKTYNDLNASNVEGTVVDNDVSGVLITDNNGLSTSENKTDATFSVTLSSKPKAIVTIPLSVSDDTEGLLSRTSLTFKPDDWDTPQKVTVTGQDDSLADGNVSYQVLLGAATSDDTTYNGLNPSDVTITNVDNDTAGFVVNPTSLSTAEKGGQATFKITPTVAPTANVTVSLASSDSTEGTVSPESVTFTATNWATPQLVTVTGVNDSTVDGAVEYKIVTSAAVSADTSYNGLNPADVVVVNYDDDVASVVVSPTSGLQTSETGKSTTFTVVLSGQPNANVTVGLSSSDTTEGTIAPSTLVFTSANWNTPQTVTVTGVDDSAPDSSVAYTIVTTATQSTDAAFNGLAVSDVTVTNLDDEISSPVVIVTPTSGLSTSESGTEATFTVVLGAAPTATAALSISNLYTTEGTVSPTSLFFTTTNWATPQTVTVKGVDDGIDDGDVTYSLVTSKVVGGGDGYDGLDVPDVTITNKDNDAVGVTVSPSSILQTTETGGTATFTVVLNCQPSSSVSIPLSSSDPTEGLASPATLSFTTLNWNVPQTVTITGVNDTTDDGDVNYSIVTGAAISLDPAYSGFDAPDVFAVNLDNDPIVPCAEPSMIDDMEDGNTTICGNGGRVGTWYVNESSTLYDSTLAVAIAARGDSTVCIETTANFSTTWATLGVTIYGTSIESRQPYDVSAYKGIRFWGRRASASVSYPSTVYAQILQTNTSKTTEGGTCNTTLYTCANHYAYEFAVTSSWTEYVLPFASFNQQNWGTAFPRNLTQVLGFEFLMKSAGAYDLEIDDLRFY